MSATGQKKTPGRLIMTMAEQESVPQKIQVKHLGQSIHLGEQFSFCTWVPALHIARILWGRGSRVG